MSQDNQNNDNGLSPEQLAERQAKNQNQQNNNNNNTIQMSSDQILEQQKQQNQNQGLATDNKGNVNVSRGIIGLVSEPQETGGITEGTVADRYNAPSILPSQKGNKSNPVTEEDLRKAIDLERSKAGMDREYQEQIAIKARTEMQGFKYLPPENFKNMPELEATPDNFQEKEPQVDKKKGEQFINVDNDIVQPQEEQGQQQNQQQNLKG